MLSGVIMKWIIRGLMAVTFGLGYVCLQTLPEGAGTLFIYYNLGLLLLWSQTFLKPSSKAGELP